MRIARNSSSLGTPDSGHDEPVFSKKMAAHSPASLIPPPESSIRYDSTSGSRAPRPARPMHERRAYTRARLNLPLQLRRVAGQREHGMHSMRTCDISSSGASFLCPQHIEPGTPIELEVSLLDRPLGRGGVQMITEAHVVRAELASRPGWHTMAVAFDEITFRKDEPLPSRFQRTL
jgi:hypothetical protein